MYVDVCACPPNNSHHLFQPENMLRRLGAIGCEEIPKEGILNYYELDNVTYPTNTSKHQELYDKATMVNDINIDITRTHTQSGEG